MPRHPLILLTLLAAATRPAPALHAPATLVPGDRPAISVDGLAPGETVTIDAYRLGPEPRDPAYKVTGPRPLFRATARFRADAHGRVVLDRAVPLAGTYAGADGRGLLWSGEPVAAVGHALPAPDEVRLELRRGNQVVAQRQVRIAPATDVAMERIDTPGLVGVFAAPRGAWHRPVVVALHGSEGGDWASAEATARRFAHHGYATFALIYFAWPAAGIPHAPASFTNLPVERLAVARAWLATRPEADVRRLSLWGASKGSEFALLAAAHYPWVRAVVACVPSSLVWGGFGGAAGAPGFTIDGRAPGMVPYGDYGPVARHEITSAERHIRDRAAAGPAAVAAATIPIERSSAHLLLLSSGQDGIWPSAAMSAEIVSRRRAAHRPVAWLNFPAAGHFICGTGDGPTRDATGKDGDQAGGTATAAGEATGRAWDATVAFLAWYGN